MFDDALTLYKSGKFADAKAALVGSCSLSELNWRELHLYLLLLAELETDDFDSKSKEVKLKHHPNEPGLFFDLGNVFLKKSKFKEARVFFTRSLSVNKEYLDPAIGLAKSLLGLKLYDEAQKAIEEIEVALKARQFESFQIASKIRYWKDDFKEALRYSEDSIGLVRDTPTSLLNHAVILSDLRRFEEGLGYYKRSLELRPNYEKAHQYMGQVLLHKGDLVNGWKHYRWRWKNSDFPSERIKTTRPELDYNALSLPRRTLVWGEQGLGEQILFATVLREASLEFESLIVQVDSRLASLYEESFSDVPNLRFIPKGAPASEEDYDAYITFGDLVARYRSTLTDLSKSQVPLIDLSRLTKTHNSRLINRLKPLVCGISWASVATQYGKLKSMSLKRMLPLLTVPDIQFVSLQYGDVTKQISDLKASKGVEIEQVGAIDNTKNLQGLVQLMGECDCVVTTSNVTAHLAGAVGRPTLMLQPVGKTLWFWDHRNDQSSLWYPSVKVYSEYALGGNFLEYAEHGLRSYH